MKQIMIAVCAGLMMIGVYAHFGLGTDIAGAFKTVFVFLLIFGVSGLLGIFGAVPGVKSAAQRMKERERSQSTNDQDS